MAIYEYHCDVLKKLESRLLHWKQQDILGDIFGKFSQTKHVSGQFTVHLQPHIVCIEMIVGKSAYQRWTEGQNQYLMSGGGIVCFA